MWTFSSLGRAFTACLARREAAPYVSTTDSDHLTINQGSEPPFRGRRQPRRGRFNVALEMRRLAVHRQSGVIAVDLVQPKAVRIVAILDDVESQAAGLVDRLPGVEACGVEKRRDVLRFHMNS